MSSFLDIQANNGISTIQLPFTLASYSQQKPTTSILPFHKFDHLPSEIQIEILSFLATIPFESYPKPEMLGLGMGTITHVFPFVSKRFYLFVNGLGFTSGDKDSNGKNDNGGSNNNNQDGYHGNQVNTYLWSTCINRKLKNSKSDDPSFPAAWNKIVKDNGLPGNIIDSYVRSLGLIEEKENTIILDNTNSTSSFSPPVLSASPIKGLTKSDVKRARSDSLNRQLSESSPKEQKGDRRGNNSEGKVVLFPPPILLPINIYSKAIFNTKKIYPCFFM